MNILAALRSVVADIAYRGTNYATEEEIRAEPFHLGDGHFGSGMYLAPNDNTALSYIDVEGDTPLLTEYKIEGRILVIKNNDGNHPIWTSRGKIPFATLETSEDVKDIVINRQEDLGQAVLDAGYDAVLLTGDFVDGGEQYLIPKGSKAKLTIRDVDQL